MSGFVLGLDEDDGDVIVTAGLCKVTANQKTLVTLSGPRNKNKQDNEVEDNQSVCVFKCEGSTVIVKDTPLLEPPPTGS